MYKKLNKGHIKNEEENMKKKILFFVICLTVLFTTACSLGNTPTSAVEKLLSKYNNNDEEIVVELDDYVNSSELSDEDAKKYKDIYLKQFKDMKYEIKDEKIDGDNATVTAQITVYDYYKAEKDANDYLTEHPEEFKKDDVYDKSLFTKYKLSKLEKVNDTVDYTIEFQLTKVDGKWEVNDLSNEQL